jgi:oxygen-independent coproporphyrinogen-3 oxidase
VEERSPIDFEETLITSARLRELLAIQLRLKKGVDLAIFQKKHGALELETLNVLEQLGSEGYLEREENIYRLSKKGILFYDSVASDLI